jgi:hypothetical protein
MLPQLLPAALIRALGVTILNRLNVMNYAASIIAGLFLLAVTSCGKPIANQSITSTLTPTPTNSDKIDCNWKGNILGDKKSGLQKFLVGKWEGRILPEQKIEMYLTFQEDGTAIIDYSVEHPNNPKGGVFYRPYRINDEKTLNICGYPDNFSVDKYGADEFDLRSDIKEMRADIEVIYMCRFKRIKT